MNSFILKCKEYINTKTMQIKDTTKKNTLQKKSVESQRQSMNLDAIVSFRIKNSDLAQLKSKAQADNRTLSSYIINLIKTT